MLEKSAFCDRLSRGQRGYVHEEASPGQLRGVFRENSGLKIHAVKSVYRLGRGEFVSYSESVRGTRPNVLFPISPEDY